MRPRIARFRERAASIVLGASAILTLGACAMTESTLIDHRASEACDSHAGNYYLSRTLFEVLVTADTDADVAKHPKRRDGKTGADTSDPDALKFGKSLISVQSKVVADKNRGYCLDFLASPTAKEAIHVQRDNGLLAKITTDSEDRSGQILKNIVKTILLAGSADETGGFRSSDEASAPLVPKQLFKGTYDPLNTAQANLVNQTLRKHGFCLMIDDEIGGPSLGRAQQYCDGPLGRQSREVALDVASEHIAQGPMVAKAHGVLYRPRVAYNYYLFVRRGHDWHLRKSVTVNLENAAPVLAVGIDRAFFTSRKTAISFDQGVLRDVQVEKGSELAGFVEVPLAIAQGIVAVPANIVKVKIDVTNQRSTLIAAQDQLLAAQRAYNEDVRAYNGVASGRGDRETGDQPATNVAALKYPSDDGGEDPVIRGMREDAATGGQRSLQTGAGFGDPQCVASCRQQGQSATSCQSFCGCLRQCGPVSGTQNARQRNEACSNYCRSKFPWAGGGGGG